MKAPTARFRSRAPRIAWGAACWLGLGAMSWAQMMEEIPLRTPAPAGAPGFVEEVTYRTGNYDDRGFNRTIQKIAVPTLTVYHPAQPGHRRAAVIMCPGGGYSAVVIDREGHAFGRYFSERGLTVAVLKYRLPQPEATGAAMPQSQQDALAAVQFVRTHATAWNIDPRRIGIMGCSAGGHLAGSVGILADEANGSRPDFVALLYPVVLMDGAYAHQGSRLRLLGSAPAPARVAEFSLERRARSGLPPHFIVHAKDDNVVPPQNSELLAAELREQQVPVELLLVATGRHGFALGRDPESARWKDAFLTWLDRLP